MKLLKCLLIMLMLVPLRAQTKIKPTQIFCLSSPTTSYVVMLQPGGGLQCVPIDGVTLKIVAGVLTAAAPPTIGPLFVDAIAPAGTINGVNLVFTVVDATGTPTAPNPASSLKLFRNGLLYSGGAADFTLSGSTITFAAGQAPQTGDSLVAYFRH